MKNQLKNISLLKKIRIDVYLQQKYQLSRQKIHALIQKKAIWCNQQIVHKKSLLVDDNDSVVFKAIPKVSNQIKKPFKPIITEALTIPVVYEDEHLLVVNKPSGLVVHAHKYEKQQTLAHNIEALFMQRKIPLFASLEQRSGIIHRIDQNTSGLVMVAKNVNSYTLFQKLFQQRKIIKKYYALIWGELATKTIKVDAPIQRLNQSTKHVVSNAYEAKKAISFFRHIQTYGAFSLVEVEIKTGITHQIRVHAQFINHPIVNDPLYGKPVAKKQHQMLCAFYLRFHHPITHQKTTITIPLPLQFQTYIQKYGH